MHKLLLTNDDGYKAAGIRSLAEVLANEYDILAVAPAHEQSWVAKSISRHHGLTVQEVEYFEFKGYTVDGTPADCSQIGMYNIPDSLPDMVVSGINIGSNAGYEEILSSGTVGAAMEAALQGVPAFASSINYSKRIQGEIDFNSQEAIENFRAAADITKRIIDKIMTAGFPADTHLVSINMPWDVRPDTPWVVTKPHTSKHEELFELVGDKYRHRGGVGLREEAEDNSDYTALGEGLVSILPMNIQLTTDAEQQTLANLLGVPVFRN